jgi:hypothetical protein
MTILVGGFLLDLLTGQLLAEGTGGDKTKIAARATEALLVISGFQAILAGTVAAGINAITTAIANNTALNPAESLAVQNLASLAVQELSLNQAIIGGTILGQAQTAIVTNVLAEITKVCIAEGGVAPVAPAAAA